MNKLSYISENKVGIFYNVGLSKLSSEYFYNSIEYNSCSCSILYKCKRRRNSINNLSKFNKIISFAAHSNFRYIEDCDFTSSMFFRKKK